MRRVLVRVVSLFALCVLLFSGFAAAPLHGEPSTPSLSPQPAGQSPAGRASDATLTQAASPVNPAQSQGSRDPSGFVPHAVTLKVPSGFTPRAHTAGLGIVPYEPDFGTGASINPNSPNDGFCAFLFTSPPGTCGNVTYNGGSVENQGIVQVVLDFWAGPSWTGCSSGLYDSPALDPGAVSPTDCGYMSLLNQYFVDMCGDTVYTELMQQYLFESVFSPLCEKYAPTLSGVTNSFVDIRSFPESPLSDGDIQNEANAAAVYEGLTSNGYNTLVVVFLPVSIGECMSGGNCFPTGNFCAYHQSTGSSVGGEIQYAVMPDVAQHGSGCVNASSSPNSDPWADAEINTVSHEQQESMTDPDGSAWNCSSTCTGAGSGAEIGDECNYDFLGTEPDGTTTRLGADGYRMQAEWSNANNGCTRDEAGAPTQVTEKIFPDTSTGTTAASQNFVIQYEEAGQDSSAASVTKVCCSGSVIFFVTPGSTALTIPNRGNEAWCFDSLCSTQAKSVSAPVTLSYFYYQMYLEQPYAKIIGGGPPTYLPTFTYNTAPICHAACSGLGDGTAVKSVKLPLVSGSLGVFVVTGTKAAVNSCIPTSISGGIQRCGSGNGERWDTGGPCLPRQPFTCTTSLTASSPDSITNVNYWNQWLFTASYSVLGGGVVCGSAPCYHPPVVVGAQFGKTYTFTLTTTPSNHWLDANTNWSAANPLVGSSSFNRWDSGGATTGTITVPVNTVFTYYHQQVMTLSYTVVGGGTPGAPALTATAWGKTGVVADLTTTPAGYWLDLGTPWSVTNPLSGSSAIERWEDFGPTSGTVTVKALDFIYNHQFFVTFAASPSADGTVTPPTGWFNAGSTFTITATPTAGHAFSAWKSSTSNIVIQLPTAASTVATINGAGTVTAKFT